MTNLEMRNAKRQLEAALLRAFNAEIGEFQGKTGLLVTGVEIGISTRSTPRGDLSVLVTGITVKVDV